MLHTLLALEQAVLCLQQPLLRALRPQAFRLLRLQLLHTLLHAIDAVLTLCALARQHLALPLLYDLLSLLDALLMLRRPRFDRSFRDGRALKRAMCLGSTGAAIRGSGCLVIAGRCGVAADAMDLGSRRCNARRGRSCGCGDMRRGRGAIAGRCGGGAARNAGAAGLAMPGAAQDEPSPEVARAGP